MRLAVAVLSVFMAVALGTLARAQQPPIAPEDDKIVLRLLAEAWVATTTANVVVSIDAAASGAAAMAIRGRVGEALTAVAADGAWHITQFNQVRDATGLERWRVLAEARLPEQVLGNLRDKADGASEPGLQVRIVHVDFSPTLAERQATLAELRAEIYQRVRDELNRLSRIYPERAYRVQQIDFAGVTARRSPEPRARGAVRSMVEAKVDDGGGGMAVALKMTSRATVILAAERN